jgi:hypothetical protein
VLKDPLTEWEGGFPYDLLAPAGITPESTAKEVKDAPFILMEQRAMSPESTRAWEILRRPDQRLMVDFFMLDEQPAPESGGRQGDDNG